MQKIITEILIPMGEHKALYSAYRCKIRVDDEGAGPFLAVTGENDEPDPAAKETGHEFFLTSMGDIDEFAQICRDMLKQAQDVCRV